MQNLGLKQGEFKGVDLDGNPKGKWTLKVKISDSS
jgi:hypothetical protein